MGADIVLRYPRIADHLVECPECQERADQLSKSGIETTRQMSALAPRAEESAQPVHLAYARFEQKYLVKENMSMLDRIFSRKYRFAWVAVGVVALLAVAMLFPQVRAIGSSFLGLFRVEQFTILQIDPENLEEQLGSSSSFEYLLAEDVQVEEFGEMHEVTTTEEASSAYQALLMGMRSWCFNQVPGYPYWSICRKSRP